MNNNREKKYWAFISYRHADNKEQDREWATWLHRELERYDIPAELVGTKSPKHGFDIPERIYPIFRDEDSLPADADLGVKIREALDASKSLVVLCSPNATESKYVNEEIDYFADNGKSHSIYSLIIGGEPNDIELDCFPSALKKVKTTSNNDSVHKGPLAADCRLDNGEEGYTNSQSYKKSMLESGTSPRQVKVLSERYELKLQRAKIKIIAGIIGVNPEDLENRDKAFQLAKAKKRQRIIISLASIFLVLAVAATMAAFIAKKQHNRAEATLEDLRNNVSFMNIDLRTLLVSYVPEEKRTPVIEQVDLIIDKLEDHDENSAENLKQLAVALTNKANELKSKNPKKALDFLNQSKGIHEKLVEGDADNVSILFNYSVIFLYIGDFHYDKSELDDAYEAYKQAEKIRSLLATKFPKDIKWQRELAMSLNRQGLVLNAQKNSNQALVLYKKNLPIVERIYKSNPSDIENIRDLYIGWNLIGNAQLDLGKLNEAIESFKKGVLINKEAYENDRKNIRFKRDLSVSYTNLGEVSFKVRLTQDAVDYYELGVNIAKELLEINSRHPVLITDLAGNYVGLGITLESQDPAKAREYLLKARELIAPIIDSNQLDEDRKKLPDDINEALARLSRVLN